jgi:CheY-like chemotaxis protein
MDKEIQGKIFDPFFTTKEIGRGTGLGLASAYGIIKGHNGIINVYSEPGQGSTFSIYLPASSKEVTRKPHLGKGVLRGSETVLLVDDEKMIIEVGRRMLEQMGYQVLVAGGGKEAVRVYEEKRDQVDLVVLDMIMPDMGGADTYDALKEINPRIKVLLASGYSINSKAAEILNRGCDGFVQKPFDMTELSRKIRGVLEQTPPQPVT